MNSDVFFGRMLLLKEFGFNPIINIVAWPEQFWLIPEFIERCKRFGLRWHVDPYESIAYYDWKFTDKQKEKLRAWVTSNREKRPPMGPVACTGGVHHLSVQPDGSAWRCILERQQVLNPIGNVFDPAFSLLTNTLRCNQAQFCPGCDRDHVTITPIQGI